MLPATAVVFQRQLGKYSLLNQPKIQLLLLPHVLCFAVKWDPGKRQPQKSGALCKVMLSAAIFPLPTAPASPAAWPDYLHQLLLFFLVLFFHLKLMNRRVNEAKISSYFFSSYQRWY